MTGSRHIKIYANRYFCCKPQPVNGFFREEELTSSACQKVIVGTVLGTDVPFIIIDRKSKFSKKLLFNGWR